MGDSEHLLGRVLSGRYRVEALLGSGGFGSVYRATHLELLRPVAIKTLLSAHGGREQLVARFRREARLQAGLRHPAIVRLLDLGQEPDGLIYMVQEFVDGVTLRDHLDATGRLEPRVAVAIIDQLLDGLESAHREGIIHRDLKPSNIMLVRGGAAGFEVRVLDFGLAKMRDSTDDGPPLTATGQLLGTPAYMAPEQVERRGVSPATDLYAVGVILHQMLTGHRPFRGRMRDVLLSHLFQAPPSLPTDCPPALCRVVERALSKAPADRYPSSGEMRAALRSSLGDLHNVSTVSVSPPDLAAMWATQQEMPGLHLAAMMRGAPAGRAPAVSQSTDWRGVVVEPSGGAMRTLAGAGRLGRWLLAVVMLVGLVSMGFWSLWQTPAPADEAEEGPAVVLRVGSHPDAGSMPSHAGRPGSSALLDVDAEPSPAADAEVTPPADPAPVRAPKPAPKPTPRAPRPTRSGTKTRGESTRTPKAEDGPASVATLDAQIRAAIGQCECAEVNRLLESASGQLSSLDRHRSSFLWGCKEKCFDLGGMGP